MTWKFHVETPQTVEGIRTNLYVSAEQVLELLAMQKKYFRERDRRTLIECRAREDAFMAQYNEICEKLYK